MPDALGPARAPLVRLAAALGTRERDRVAAALDSAATAVESGEVAAAAVDEVLLQSHLFVGFPDALEAVALWRERSPAPVPAASGEDPDAWTTRGERVCARVYGANYEKLRRNVRALHPDLDHWMVTGGYGRVLGRPALDLATRELCVAALLATWGAPRQLHSHLRGALNAGASTEDVDDAVRIASRLTDHVVADESLRIWSAVRERAAGRA